jgi:glycosyltransferase involved in cell wall biosynthesis
MEKNKKLLTIGMPVYNEAKYIGEAIESLLAQTYKDFILIISDNGSTDRTPEICKYYAEKDKRIIFVQHPKNKGSLFNFKYVLDKANTPFFMWAGGHDKWHPQFIEKLLPIIVKNKNLVLIYPQTREIKEDGTLGEIYSDDYTTIGIEKPANRYLFVLKHVGKCNIIHGIWRTSIIKDCWPKPVIGYDVLQLLKASFKGVFKQQKDVLFFRRTTRKEKNKYRAQFSKIIGENYSKTPAALLLKCQFIFENVKMLYQMNSSLSSISKLLLSMQTIYFWINQWYIKPFLVKIAKIILPSKIYLFLKDRVKSKSK